MKQLFKTMALLFVSLFLLMPAFARQTVTPDNALKKGLPNWNGAKDELYQQMAVVASGTYTVSTRVFVTDTKKII